MATTSQMAYVERHIDKAVDGVHEPTYLGSLQEREIYARLADLFDDLTVCHRFL